MLILTRRTGEAVDFKDTRRDEAMGSVVVLAVPQRNVVRLGFEMEPHISVLRDNAIQVQRGRAAGAKQKITDDLLQSVAFEHLDSGKFEQARRELQQLLKENAHGISA